MFLHNYKKKKFEIAHFHNFGSFNVKMFHINKSRCPQAKKEMIDNVKSVSYVNVTWQTLNLIN